MPLTPAVAGAYREAVAAIKAARPDTCLLLELPPRHIGEYRDGLKSLQ